VDKETISRRFKEFLASYSEEEHDAIWERHSANFREFWAQRILKQKSPDLTEAEIDQIVLILDINAKGNTRQNESVARVMTPQGVWRRLFRELRQDQKIREPLDAVFRAADNAQMTRAIDDLYKKNEGRKNGLTGQSGSVVNSFCVAYTPLQHLSVISLKDRRSIIETFAIPGGPHFDTDSPGKKMTLSNKVIIDWFNSLGTKASPRTMSRFFYSSLMKDAWKGDSAASGAVVPVDTPQADGGMSEDTGRRLFYMESQLEDFLIENWEKTELGKRFDLIEEGDEIVSQQYRTDNPHIGTIDILVRDKKTKQYVIIELKKGQTSDETIGQLTRYMGWIEEHKTAGAPTRGLIIAGEYDQKLRYALKKIKDVEVYIYRVDFKLDEFKQ
jgi:Holliday junction resolvase-like predicted endonuclease